MKHFICENKIIVFFLVVSKLVIILHFVSLDKPEWFPHAGDAFDVLHNIAIGYVVNFFFYVTQIYIPSVKRNKIIYSCINERLTEIGNTMTDLFEGITGVKKPYDDSFFEELLAVRLNAPTKIGDASKSNSDRIVYFTLRELLWNNINTTNNKIDTFISYYKEYLQPEIMLDLDAIKNSLLHKAIKTVLVCPGDYKFKNMNETNYYKQYYELAINLLKDNKKYYSGNNDGNIN